LWEILLRNMLSLKSQDTRFSIGNKKVVLEKSKLRKRQPLISFNDFKVSLDSMAVVNTIPIN
jgi:hypothetical protein